MNNVEFCTVNRMRCTRSFIVVAVSCALMGCEASLPNDTPMTGQLRLGAVLGAANSEGFEDAERIRSFVFPADHGPHDRFRSEWWYLTVILANEFGAEFGVQFTVFRQALKAGTQADNPWRIPQVYMAHAAVTAVREQRHWEAQRLARAHPRLAGATAAPFRVWVDGWELRGRNGGFAEQRLEIVTEARLQTVNLFLDVSEDLWYYLSISGTGIQMLSSDPEFNHALSSKSEKGKFKVEPLELSETQSFVDRFRRDYLKTSEPKPLFLQEVEEEEGN